jgi:hypothetical protein
MACRQTTPPRRGANRFRTGPLTAGLTGTDSWSPPRRKMLHTREQASLHDATRPCDKREKISSESRKSMFLQAPNPCKRQSYTRLVYDFNDLHELGVSNLSGESHIFRM